MNLETDKNVTAFRDLLVLPQVCCFYTSNLHSLLQTWGGGFQNLVLQRYLPHE